MKMTEKELLEEFRYRVEERLGILAGDLPATLEQRTLAVREANETVRELSKSET